MNSTNYLTGRISVGPKTWEGERGSPTMITEESLSKLIFGMKKKDTI